MSKTKATLGKNPLQELDAVFFDFDGVLTDNRVWVDETGRESVACSRSDGLAFEVLRATSLKLFIFSREANPVVSKRAEKLRVPCFQSTLNKQEAAQELCKQMGLSMDRILFVGNDLNDYHVMGACGFSACPSDSHPSIRRIATFKLASKGGEGAVLELVQKVLRLDILAHLEKKGTPNHA